MDVFSHLRRFTRLILLALIGLVLLKALFICTFLDILLLLGLTLILLALISGPC
ncbi:MAG: hypothetical protein ACM3X6_03830 [Patescibacteria group bacterium]